MRRRSLVFAVCMLALGLSAFPYAPATATDMPIAIVTLHHRTADDVIPLLRPFLVPGGAMSGSGYKLIIKTTPKNLASIKKLIADIDSGLKELVISVRQGNASSTHRRSASIHGNVQVGAHGGVSAGGDGIGPYAKSGGTGTQAGGNGTQVSGQFNDEQSQTESPSVQRINVLEGQWANITTGIQYPVVQRQRNPDGSISTTVQYKDVTRGFRVLPRVHGDQVTLEIRPSNASLSPQGSGVINTQQAQTTVSGKLGQWIQIGGISQNISSQLNGITYLTQKNSGQITAISVKVELAK